MLKKYRPYINWKEINGVSCLYFQFGEILRVSSAEKGIARWNKLTERRINEQSNNDKLIVIWDCLLMKNYETKARVAWQKNLKAQRDTIDTIWLITTSPLVLAGAEIISFFSSFTIKTVASVKELEKNIVLN